MSPVHGHLTQRETARQTLINSLNLYQEKKIFQESSIIITSLLILLLQGKMKLHIFLLLVILVVGDSIKSNPELQRNILKFGYGINYKYEGMLAHSFDRFYIVM